MPAAIVMKPADNVATVLGKVPAMSPVAVRRDDAVRQATVEEDIPAGHKFALTDIEAGQPIMKYGQIIGLATRPIKAGRHVHIHNVESCRGRGDRTGGEI